MSIAPSDDRPTPVVVRAYGDEPVELLAVGERPGYVEVTRQGTGVSIGFPVAYVYEYSAQLVADLRDAYAAGDHDRLHRLWSVARRVA